MISTSAIPDWLIPLGLDLALMILVFEGFILAAYRWWTGRALPFLTVLLISTSGIGLLLALKAAIMGAAGHWIALGLAVGGISHALDIFRRLKGAD